MYQKDLKHKCKHSSSLFSLSVSFSLQIPNLLCQTIQLLDDLTEHLFNGRLSPKGSIRDDARLRNCILAAQT